MIYFHADLEIFRKTPTQRQASQRVLVSIKPRAPAIKTLYIAEKSRFHCRKVLYLEILCQVCCALSFPNCKTDCFSTGL